MVGMPAADEYRRLSFWHETAPGTLEPGQPLPGDLDADVAIAGAGYTGLWTAYYLSRADPGLKIAVCERDIPVTFMLLWTVQRAAEIQCQAAALGGDHVLLSEAVQRRCRDTVADFGSGIRVARLLFDATVRRMQGAAPG